MKKFIPILVIAVVLSGAGSFFTGLKLGQNKSGAKNLGNFSAEQFQRLREGADGLPRRGNGTGMGQNAGFSAGEIISKDDSSLTIKLRDGGSKIVFYSPSTTINRLATGTAEDLLVGGNIIVNGSSNADGSLTANSLQLTNGQELKMGLGGEGQHQEQK